jgi:O-antigen/teichoic acid export membrane protein
MVVDALGGGSLNLIRKGFWTLVFRALGAGLTLFSTVIFARVLGVDDFGLFSLGLTIITITSILVRAGMDNVVLKQVAAHSNQDEEISNGYIYSSLILICSNGLIVSVIIWVLADTLSLNVFNKPDLGGFLQLLSLVIVPMSVAFILGETNKALGRTAYAAFLQAVLPIFITLTVFSVLSIIEIVSLGTIGFAVIFGYLGSALTSAKSLLLNIVSIKRIKVRLFDLYRQGFPMLLVSAGAMVMSWADTITLGIFCSASDVGVYFAASRTALVTTLILVAVNAVSGPIYARLHKEGKIEEIATLAKKSSMLLLLIVMLPTSFLLLFPEWVMHWFGEGFSLGASILVVLTVGQLVNVTCGSVGCLLVMTGNEKIMRNIILITAAMNIILNVLLVREYGPIGVAYATAFSTVMWNIWAMVSVKKRLGFWMFGYNG